MPYVRLFIFSVLALLLIVFGISFLIPQHVRISRTITIAASKDSVLAHIKEVERWTSWYPGLQGKVPLVVKNGKPSGFFFQDSEPGKYPVYIAITEVKENEVLAEFVPRNVNPVINGWNVEESTAGSTTIQWYMNFNLRWYPWEKFASLTLEKTYGPPMQEGLNNLKNQVEN